VIISDRVWQAWRAHSSEEVEWSVDMQLRPSTSSAAAKQALTDTMREIMATWDGEHPECFFGEWGWARAKDSVILTASESGDFPRALDAVRSGLQVRGVDGSVDTYEGPSVPEPPTVAHLLECRLRVRGQPVGQGQGAEPSGWAAFPESMAAIVKTAVAWCVDGGRRGGLVLSVGLLAPIVLSADDDVAEHVLDALDPPWLLHLRTLEPGQLRCVAVDPGTARVSLVETTGPGQWQAPVEGLTTVLEACADHAAYGFLRHGSAVNAAIYGHSLSADWPWRAGVSPGDDEVPSAFAAESRWAPDAFAIQLLGSGYAGRIPDPPGWRHQNVGRASVLLQDEQLHGWFGHEFVQFGSDYGRAQSAPIPEILHRARQDLEPILRRPRARHVTL
jgi:hypothetical protein